MPLVKPIIVSTFGDAGINGTEPLERLGMLSRAQHDGSDKHLLRVILD